MAVRFYNFLSKKVEEFKPLNPPDVTLYTCGPTVYDFVHIGNWRTFIFEDILRRVLESSGFKVKQVMNITDIDDKIIAAARSQRLAFSEIASKYEKLFFEDLGKLNIKRADYYPKATENITTILDIIGKLIEKGFAYKTDDGVYFDISKFANYGELSNLSKRKIKPGARIAADLYDKNHPADFALWKSSKPDEPSWSAPFGAGRPGWHIECSAMSMKYLGGGQSRTIDIHTGAVDLIFPHHENEIAQSEAATGVKFVNFWLEGEHLLVEGQKMSKSLDNIFTLKDLENRGFDPTALKYLVLTAHYRSKLNFTWKGLEAAANSLENLKQLYLNWQLTGASCQDFESEFTAAVNNDLDTPAALAVLWKMAKSDIPESEKSATLLDFDKVLGLGVEDWPKAKMPAGAKELIAKRESLRAKGEFAQADKIRLELRAMSVVIEDTKEGPKIKIKN